MDSYRLTVPANKKQNEIAFIKERIRLLELKLRTLTGIDRRRALTTIDFNQRLLKDRQATVDFHACR